MKIETCRAEDCRAPIVWVKTAKGNNMPVDAGSLTPEDRDALNCGAEVIYRHKEHKSHWDTCKNARQFRTKKS